MRVLCCLILFASAAVAWAQNEPCLADVHDPACGIKVTLDPPPKPDENVFWAPNTITVDVPARLKAAKVSLTSGSAGSQLSDKIVEAPKSKKTKSDTRFTLAVPSCSGIGSALQVNIYSPKFPYPMA